MSARGQPRALLLPCPLAPGHVAVQAVGTVTGSAESSFGAVGSDILLLGAALHVTAVILGHLNVANGMGQWERRRGLKNGHKSAVRRLGLCGELPSLTSTSCI